MGELPAGTADGDISYEELQLAARNHGMPLEALRYDVTPVGLHYLLIHYDIPSVDAAAWRLRVGGLVEEELSLGLDDVLALPSVTRRVTMECAGNGRARLRPRTISQPWLHEAIGTGEWTGTPLAGVLEAAGTSRDAREVVFTGLDRGVEGGVDQHYERSLPVEDAQSDGPLLVHALNGTPLPPQHGAPLRLLVPGWYGMASVKWLQAITAVAEPFEGYQQTRAYRLRQDSEERGEPLNRIAVRSLMAPPGVPDFLTRRRFVERGTQEITGRAWSGHGAITAVEVSTDGGRTWADATITPPDGAFAWTGWSFRWDAETPGEHELCCRATDATGNTQPLESAWNLGGYAVNGVQRVPVTVRNHS
ncbi:MAG: sulfite oxidase [Nitriliruptorales bacterium]